MFRRIVVVGVVLSVLLLLEARRRRESATNRRRLIRDIPEQARRRRESATDRRRLIRDNPELPTDILSDILIRLPAVSLQRLKSVSKQWLQIISDPDFVEAHLHSHQTQFELVFCHLADRTGKNTFFLERGPKLAYAEKIKMISASRFHGSCRGLILLDRDCVFYVANPVTGHTLRLPYHGIGSPINANIGFITSSREFKVVMVDFDRVDHTSTVICRILTLYRQGGSSAWREVDVPFPDGIKQYFKSPHLAGGNLHWIQSCSNTIISMDLEREKFYRQAAIPNYFPTYSEFSYGPFFLQYDGCLSLAQEQRGGHSYSIFTLRKFGWTTELEVDINFFKQLCPSEVIEDIHFFKQLCPSEVIEGHPPQLVASLRDGEVIIFMNAHEYDEVSFFAYHLRSKEMIPFKAVAPPGSSLYLRDDGYCPAGFIMVHVDSLVSW